MHVRNATCGEKGSQEVNNMKTYQHLQTNLPQWIQRSVGRKRYVRSLTPRQLELISVRYLHISGRNKIILIMWLTYYILCTRLDKGVCILIYSTGVRLVGGPKDWDRRSSHL